MKAAWAGALAGPWRALRMSLRWRLVALFVLLALAMTVIFMGGVQRAFATGWTDAGRPLLVDYVDRLAADLVVSGQPSAERAEQLTKRLPITVAIVGPQVNWSSHPARSRANAGDHGEGRWLQATQRPLVGGHTVSFGIDADALSRRPRLVGYTLAALLLLTLLAYLYVRRLLRPLDSIQAGAQRFGRGDFAQPIAVQNAARADELGQLAATLNAMGRDIAQLLEAKRALLLAISHELRSPLTRARLSTELLPETAEVGPQRDALLRDLQEMSSLISDLLESERLATPHAALQRESVALPELVQTVLTALQARYRAVSQVRVCVSPSLPSALLDPGRISLLLRNLLDNALRHAGDAAEPPQLHLRWADGQFEIEVRDFGPGVADDQLAHLAEPFYRPDSARTRAQGGVGLGLYLCRLVAQAHGGTFAMRNAKPGLSVTIRLPITT